MSFSTFGLPHPSARQDGTNPAKRQHNETYLCLNMFVFLYTNNLILDKAFSKYDMNCLGIFSKISDKTHVLFQRLSVVNDRRRWAFYL